MYLGGGDQGEQPHSLAEVTTEASFAIAVCIMGCVYEVCERSRHELRGCCLREAWAPALHQGDASCQCCASGEVQGPLLRLWAGRCLLEAGAELRGEADDRGLRGLCACDESWL